MSWEESSIFPRFGRVDARIRFQLNYTNDPFHCSCFYMCGSEAGRFRQSYTFQPRFASCGTQVVVSWGPFPLSGSNSLVGGKRPVEAPWKLISMRRRLCALPCWMVFGYETSRGNQHRFDGLRVVRYDWNHLKKNIPSKHISSGGMAGCP